MKNLRLLAVALVALAMVSLSGCQAIYKMSQDYQIEQAEKAAKAKQAADRAYYEQFIPKKNLVNALTAEYEQNRAEWEAKHPDDCYDCLPLSSAPDAKRVEINGKSYYCAHTASGGIRCE